MLRKSKENGCSAGKRITVDQGFLRGGRKKCEITFQKEIIARKVLKKMVLRIILSAREDMDDDMSSRLTTSDGGEKKKKYGINI